MGCCGDKKKKKKTPEEIKEGKKLPPISRRVKNFAKAVYTHVKSGSKQVDDKVYLKRMRECLKCPHLVRKSKACSICGCYVHTKTRWAEQECPDKPPRWEAED